MRVQLYRNTKHWNWTIAGVFFVLLLLSFIYWNRHSSGVLVDAVIEIGQGGFHRKYALSNTLDLSSFQSGRDNVYLPLEQGADLMEALDIKYQFDRSQKPRLISRVRKTQLRQYSRIIILTVEGDNEEDALAYMGNIIESVIQRHDRIFEKRAKYTKEYVGSMRRAMNEQIRSCLNPTQGYRKAKDALIGVDQTKSCHAENMVNLVVLLSRINYLTSEVNVFRSSVLLKPTVR